MSDDPHQIVPFPRPRRLVTDVGRIVGGRPVIRGLVEIDCTEPRRRIRRHQKETGEKLSFTAFLAACLGEAIESHKIVHACRDWRGRLVLFDDVDIATMIEVDPSGAAPRGGMTFPVGHIIRASNRKTVRQISDEIREVQQHPTDEKNVRRLMLSSYVPGVLRRLFIRTVDRSPRWTKQLKGTVVLSSVGMFGHSAAWGLGLPTHRLGVIVGGIAEKPGVVDGRIEPREFLHVTLDFDHDVVDGAPAARFSQHFSDLVRSGAGLPE